MSRPSRRERLQQRREAMKSDGRRNRWFLILIVAGFALVIGAIVIKKQLGNGPVDLNRASAEKLDTLPGIGPETAREIIKGRPYETIEDLDKVKGIGPATIDKLRGQVEVSP